MFFKGCEIIGNEILYYPAYEIKLSAKNRSRIYIVSAVNGKVIG
jgi:hypothetical protein